MRWNQFVGSVMLLSVAAIGSAAGDTLSPHYERADSLLIVKSERKLYLLRPISTKHPTSFPNRFPFSGKKRRSGIKTGNRPLMPCYKESKSIPGR